MAISILLQKNNNYTVDLIEKHKEWQISSTGLYTPANGLAAISKIGILDKTIEAGFIIKKRIFIDEANKEILNIDLNRIWGDRFPCLSIKRKALHNVLVGELNNVNVILGCELKKYEQKNEKLKVELTNGLFKQYDLIIAADGLHSKTRNLLLGKQQLRTVNSSVCRFVTKKPANINNWTIFGSKYGQFLAIPVSDNEVYCYVNNKYEKNLKTDDYINPFYTMPDVVQEMLVDYNIHNCYWDETKELQPLKVFGKNKIVLIGDAAHAMPPFMAQGGALALEDAVILADLLNKNDNWTYIAENFTALRKQRVQWTRSKNNRREKLGKLPLWVIKIGAKYYKGNDWVKDYKLLANFI